jgi:hypothetical protein
LIFFCRFFFALCVFVQFTFNFVDEFAFSTVFLVLLVLVLALRVIFFHIVSIEKTSEMISAIISKPAMKPKLLGRPPFRFLHDVMFNIMNKTAFAIDKFSDEEKDSKAMPKSSRVTVLQKIIDITSQTLGIDINVAPSKVTAGKECEKPRVFLQYFCIAATGKKLSAGSASTAPAPAPKKLRPVEQPKAREPEPEPVESKTDQVQLPEKPRGQLSVAPDHSEEGTAQTCEQCSENGSQEGICA